MKEKRTVIYYDDIQNDEFSTAQIKPRFIDEKYKYIRNGIFGKFTHFFWYRIIATPAAVCYLKFNFHHRIVNRDILRNEKGGFFIYGNHTQVYADPLIPSMVCRPRSTYVIVHPNNVSMPVLGRITPSLGALPLPGNIAASRNFLDAIKKRTGSGCPVCIYPEAHIWPYYTKIREFSDTSFSYPVMCNKPVYCFTNTYQKSKNGKHINIVTYVDGPFTVPEGLSSRAARESLRKQVYDTMVKRSENNNVEKIKYIKRDTKEHT